MAQNTAVPNPKSSPASPQATSGGLSIRTRLAILAIVLILYFYGRSYLLKQDPVPKTVARVSTELKLLASAAVEEYATAKERPADMDRIHRRLPDSVRDRVLSNPDYRYELERPSEILDSFPARPGIIFAFRRQDAMGFPEDCGAPIFLAIDLDTLDIREAPSRDLAPMDLLRLKSGRMPASFQPCHPIPPSFRRAWQAMTK